MTTQHPVVLGDGRQKSVQDLIQQINQRIDAIPRWVRITFLASLIILEVALVFSMLEDCAAWRGHYNIPSICRPVVHFTNWCAAQPYCKPLVQTIGWLR